MQMITKSRYLKNIPNAALPNFIINRDPNIESIRSVPSKIAKSDTFQPKRIFVNIKRRVLTPL